MINGIDSTSTYGFLDDYHKWQQFLRSITIELPILDYLINIRTEYKSMFSADEVYFAQYLGMLLDLVYSAMVSPQLLILAISSHAVLLRCRCEGLEDSGTRGLFCYGFFPNLLIPTHLSGEPVEDFTES